MRVRQLLSLVSLMGLAACGDGGLGVTDPTDGFPAINPAVGSSSVDGLQVIITGLPDADPSPDSELLVFSPNGDGQLDNVTLSLAASGPSIQESPRLYVRQGQLLSGTIVAGWGFSSYLTPPGYRVLGVVIWPATGKPEGEYRARGWSLQTAESDTAPRMVRLLVDRTAPVVSDLGVPQTEVSTSSGVEVTALATDALSPIAEAQYRIDGGPWQALGALDNAFDALAETVHGTFTAPAPGSYLVCVRARDMGQTWSDGTTCASLLVGENQNQAPTADAGGEWSGNEGSAIAITGSGGDPDGGQVAYLWSTSESSCSIAAPTSAATTVTCADNGNYTLTLTVTDDESSVATDQAVLTVANVAPQVSITSPASGSSFLLVSGALPVSATYSDASVADTHACTISLNSAPEVVSGPFNVSGGACNGSIVPPQAGSYTLTVRVRDDDGDEGVATVGITVVGLLSGSVTGGGWVEAPDGRVTFALTAKYEEGTALPKGKVEVDLPGPKLKLQSADFHWLVVSPDGSAQLSGVGSLNGVPGYHFKLWLTDGKPGLPDTFRVRLWTGEDESAVVYELENLLPLSGGSLTVRGPSVSTTRTP